MDEQAPVDRRTLEHINVDAKQTQRLKHWLRVVPKLKFDGWKTNLTNCDEQWALNQRELDYVIKLGFVLI